MLAESNTIASIIVVIPASNKYYGKGQQLVKVIAIKTGLMDLRKQLQEERTKMFVACLILTAGVFWIFGRAVS